MTVVVRNEAPLAFELRDLSADYPGIELGPARDGYNERVEALPLPGTAYQRVLYTQAVEVTRNGGAWLVLVPVTERGDAIGLLEPSMSHHPDSEAVDYLVAAAHALAYVLIASRRYTDLFEWAQRDIPFSIAAEIQRRLLPSSYTAEGGPFTLAGWLEPAHTAGGDSSTTPSTASTCTSR